LKWCASPIRPVQPALHAAIVVVGPTAGSAMVEKKCTVATKTLLSTELTVLVSITFSARARDTRYKRQEPRVN